MPYDPAVRPSAALVPVAAALLLGAGGVCSAGKSAAPSLVWASSYDEAVEEATERGLPVYVHSHGST